MVKYYNNFDPFYESYGMKLVSTPEKKDVAAEDEFNEEYIGRLPEFIKVAELFDKMIEKAKEDPKKMNPNSWKENEQICTILAKVFGLKRVWFYWVPHDMRNAYTVTIHSFLVLGDSKELVEYRPGRGFYDTSHRSVFTIYGYCGLLLEETKMTGSELLAIFLHELGHNFDYSPYHHVSLLTEVAIKAGGSTIDQNNKVKMDYYDQVTDTYDPYYDGKRGNERREKERARYQKAIERYLNSGLLKNFLSSVANIIALPMWAIVSIPTQLSGLGDKKGEQFADSFATAYGYGPELISALIKLGTYDNVKVTNAGRATVFFRDLNNCLNEIINGLIECHGTDQERCKDCILKLRKDLANSDYPKDMKKDLEVEIDRLEQMYIAYMTTNPVDRDKITKSWRRLCDKVFGGKFNIAKWFKPNQM